MVSDDKDIAEVRKLRLDQTLDVRGGDVLSTRCDDQVYKKNNNSMSMYMGM